MKITLLHSDMTENINSHKSPKYTYESYYQLSFLHTRTLRAVLLTYVNYTV